MVLNNEKLPIKLLELFIIFSPLEHIARVEQVGYVIIIGFFLLAFFKILELKRGLKFVLVLFMFHLLICCFWSPSNNAMSSGLVKLVVFSFLILAVQFDYTKEDYAMIKRAFLIQGMLLVVICCVFGSFKDNRLWISTSSSGSDPNYLSTWFIFPLIYACDELINSNNKGIWKLLVGIEMVAIYACVFLTASRSGFVTNILVVALYIVYCFRETIRKNPIKALGLVLIIIVASICIINFMPDYLIQRLTQTNSMGSRGRAWKELLATMNDDWGQSIIGFGESATIYHNTQGAVYGYSTGGLVAHNTFLEVAFNNGIIGIMYFLILIIGGTIQKVRERQIEIVIGTFGMCVALFTLSALSTRPVTFMLLLLLIDVQEG